MLKRIRKALDGHFTMGPMTVYGFNAMHVAANVRTRWGYVCFHPGWGVWPWTFYVSPNGTPWASTFARGPGLYRQEIMTAPVRRALFGWRFDTDLLSSYEPYVSIKDDAEHVARGLRINRRGSLSLRRSNLTEAVAV